MNAVILILSDARGQYIPSDFVTDQYGQVAEDHCKSWGINLDDALLLALGPERGEYWEDWQYILDNAQYTDENGNVYRLHQDGDLWGICYELMTKEEKRNLGFED